MCCKEDVWLGFSRTNTPYILKMPLLYSSFTPFNEKKWLRQMSVDLAFSNPPLILQRPNPGSIETYFTPDVLYNECLIHVISPLTIIPAYVGHALEALFSQVLLLMSPRSS